MKTAMQELIDHINEQGDFVHPILFEFIQTLLEKEKEQIVNAYNDGVNDGNTQGLLGKEGNGNYVTLEEYYNQTFK